MPRYQISNGNIIIADQSFIDANYPGATLLPDVDPVVKPPISVLEFRTRFTQSEKQAIYTAASSSIDIRIWLDDLAAASDVKTDDPRTVEGVQALEAAGLLAPGRAAEILA